MESKTDESNAVLPPDKVTKRLINSSAQLLNKTKIEPNIQITDKENSIEKIFLLLHHEKGHDFSLYKLNPIYRRIERRMKINNIKNIKDYVLYLQKNKKEVELLFENILINVTNFFRDIVAFKVLDEEIIDPIYTKKNPHENIRVWVPGCSTGEEAYSIAILFQEKKEKQKKDIEIKIFATDIDTQALAVATEGNYPATISNYVSKKQLEHYFTLNREGNTYKINNEIRNTIVFSEHNFIKDPPFSKIDIISCRNSLIYMTKELQKKVFPMFHDALNSGGFLFLGTSESIGDFLNLFDETNRKYKIYQKKETKVEDAFSKGNLI
ncbi:MAG: hypothetical protein A2015_07715 [Spirochaetes bacterium GWF1_31_7]|nr:MAG: hypothetical protein A2Y30_01810 [Spirochaetes bacterium GWE1_32_154]OHD46928.1 MAG: hypothetical protein A2015_07715 [Spirochaetes bacterium GWF1_31_7]OHD48706.1 MAG: hypothetical protein A2Y29_13945 [Spirochaetes bacterium GWE2_31_10]OHD81827.1 MAG: hypothetical protein A2355_01345 [Spirochaetes bacterium RIFOXYB1_FULL_32_8]